jgi:hypothetical protein
MAAIKCNFEFFTRFPELDLSQSAVGYIFKNYCKPANYRAKSAYFEVPAFDEKFSNSFWDPDNATVHIVLSSISVPGSTPILSSYSFSAFKPVCFSNEVINT